MTKNGLELESAIIKAREWLGSTTGERMSILRYLADRTNKKWAKRKKNQ